MLTLNEIATQLKVSKRTVYRWVKSGKLKVLKLDGTIRVEEEAYNQFLGKGEVQKAEPVAREIYTGRESNAISS